MAIYTGSKLDIGQQFPEHVIDTSWQRHEPLLTPEQFRARFLFGIPLVSNISDPVSGKRQAMTDVLLKDYIERAVEIAAEAVGIHIMPAQLSEKYPFDRNLFESFGYLQLEHRPVSSVDALSIRPANNVDIYSFPMDFVEVTGLQRGQLNLVPIGSAIGVSSSFQGGGGSGIGYLLALAGARGWIPAWWNVTYTVGFVDGMLPKLINELIGTIAAIEVLCSLAATHANSTSHSLGIDGMSQSISSPGPDVYTIRTTQLSDKRDKTVQKLKAIFGLKMFSGHV